MNRSSLEIHRYHSKLLVILILGALINLLLHQPQGILGCFLAGLCAIILANLCLMLLEKINLQPYKPQDEDEEEYYEFGEN